VLVGVDGGDIFAFDLFSLTPLPVPVLVVVDGFLCFRRSFRHVFRQVFVVLDVGVVLVFVFVFVDGRFFELCFCVCEFGCVRGDNAKAFW